MQPTRNHRDARPTSWLLLSVTLLIGATLPMPACSPPPVDGNANGNANANDNSPVNMNDGTAGTDISADTTMDMLQLAGGDSLTIGNDAVLTITGDADIAGSIDAVDSRVTLVVEGDLTVSGTLRSRRTGDAAIADDAPFDEHAVGVFIVVRGAVTLTASAVVQTDGNVIITDDPTVLDGTPADAFDDVEDVSGDELPTFVPLPPDNEAFNSMPSGVTATRGPSGGDPPITISGMWPNPADPPPAGDRPVIIFRFNGNRDLNLLNWVVQAPPAPNGADADPMNNQGPRPGKNGLRLNILNNGGPINLNNVVISLADGGDGGSDTAACGTATGADGGKSGNMRMTASGGINLNGPVTINPGFGGDGGAATVTQAAAGAAGCAGETGAASTATGGKGADNRKRLFARGNVNGLANLTLGALLAGSGGAAEATACDGGPGIACCDGGVGGAATSTGGAGGAASLSVGTLPVTTGAVVGGDGGTATATGGKGGNGGPCKFFDGGDGGAGGAATATAGAGGSASGGTSTGGNSGDAVATGGDGGDGGDSGFGMPGTGGAGGAGTAIAAAAGTGTTAGTAGETDGNDGMAGGDGAVMAVTIVCLPVRSFVPDVMVGEPIPPVEYVGPLLNEDETDELGAIPIVFVDTGTEFNYQVGQNPPHIGIGDGQLDIVVSALEVQDPLQVIGGLRIVPLQGFNIDAERPLTVRAIGGEREVGMVTFDTIPTNFGMTGTPQVLDALFDVSESVDVFQIQVPFDTFVTIDRIYLLDP